MKRILCSLICLMTLTVTAMAAPSVNGSTGTIDNPSADVLRSGQFAVGYYNLKDGGVGTLNANIARNVELGVAAFRYDAKPNRTIVNAKFALVPEEILVPGLAVGIEDIADTNKRSAYVVTSKVLPFGFRLHAGLGSGRFDGVFASLEKTINPISVLSGSKGFPATTLIIEHNGRGMNYGARLSLAAGLKLDTGWRSNDFYVGVSYTK